jgi:hypothetical protein
MSNSVGSFQSEDLEGGSQQGDSVQPHDSTQVAPPLRQAATRHKATQKSNFTAP